MKVPTELVYSADGKTCRIGFEIGENEPRLQHFKLGLSPEHSRDRSYLTITYLNSLEKPPDVTQSPKNLCRDYLRRFLDHVMTFLKSRLGEAVLRTTPIEAVLTVPAMFDDKARDLTRECARAAGFDMPIHMIAEPEAAITVSAASDLSSSLLYWRSTLKIQRL